MLRSSIRSVLSDSSSSVYVLLFLENVNPGPGMYEEINTLSDRGHYSVAKSHGFGKRIFDKEQRVAMF